MALVGGLADSYYAGGTFIAGIVGGVSLAWYGAVDRSDRYWAWLGTFGCFLLSLSIWLDSLPLLIAGGALAWASLNAITDVLRWRPSGRPGEPDDPDDLPGS